MNTNDKIHYMKVKLISLSILAIVLLGGGYFGYTYYDEQMQIKAQKEAAEKAQAQALAQRQAEEAAMAQRTKCAEAGDYFVVTLDHNDAPGQDILVKQKADGQACKYEVGGDDFEVKSSDPEYFKAIAGTSMITDLGTGPNRSFRLYDLKDKKLITEKQYFGDLSIKDTTLTYTGLSKQKADAKTCKEFKQITKDGLTPNLVVEKVIDLKTLLVKEGKTTKCVSSQ